MPLESEPRPDLTDLLEKLLGEHRVLAQEQFLEQAPLRPASGRSLIGQVLGPYKLISRIGEGAWAMCGWRNASMDASIAKWRSSSVAHAHTYARLL